MAVFFQDFRSLNGERRQVIVEERDLYDSFLRDLIRQAQDEGIVCPDIEPKLAAITDPRDDELDLPLVPAGWRSLRRRDRERLRRLRRRRARLRPATHKPGHRRQLAPLPPGLEEFETNGSAAGEVAAARSARRQDGAELGTLSGP